jgi:mRNA-degrading endonuclease RelE of RelBE toxin-antitoxin system
MAANQVRILQSSAFARSYKKLHDNQKEDVDSAVHDIVENPLIGEQKRGDLLGVFVHKFKSQSQLMLLAYEFDPETRHLMLLGTHENFYRERKRS